MVTRKLAVVLSLSGLAIVLLDVIAAFATMRYGFDYDRTAWMSYTIYALAGFFAARCAGATAPMEASHGIALGALGGACTSLVDASIGWAVSWIMGPGRPPGGWPGFGFIAFVVGMVVTYGTVLGVVGGLLRVAYSRWSGRRRAAA